MKRFPDILKEKRDYYGDTEAAIEFAAEEFLRQSIPTYLECKKFSDVEFETSKRVISKDIVDPASYSLGIDVGIDFILNKLNKALE